MRTFDPKKKTMEELLLQHMLIPKYQRPYTWNIEQIKQLAEDLKLSEGDSHFLGVVVLHNKNPDEELDATSSSAARLEIIDGQQRVLTLTILIALLRNLFKIEGMDTEANGLHTLIESPSARGPDERKLQVPERLRSFFYDHIQKLDADNHEKLMRLELSSHPVDIQNVIKNYRKFFTELTLEKEWLENPKKVLLKFRELLLRTEIIEIRVNSEEDAYDLFETLNARSIRLSEVDMIKNRLFMQLRSRLEESVLEQSWDNIVVNVAGEKRTPSEVQKFISNYWWSREKKVSPRQIFRELRTRNGQKELEKLTSDSHLYRQLVSTDSTKLLKPRGINLEDLKLIGQLLNLKQVNTPLLSILRKLSQSDFREFKIKQLKQLINDLEKFIVAYSFSSRSPSTIENMYSENAIKIFKAKNRSQYLDALLDFRKDLGKNFPTNEEFQQKIINFKYIPNNSKNNRLISYILEKIYFGESSELKLDESNIDHIYPQRPSDKLNQTDKMIQPHLHSLGNLTALSSELNSASGNKLPKEKILIYKKSKITHNHKLADIITKDGWDFEKIEVRTDSIQNQIWDYLSGTE